MYAIVDIETTGGHAAANSITEVAIILHDGEREEGRYQTLVNPGFAIPKYITALTGITDSMVRDAPSFASIAEKVHRLLQDRVFVAHNVNFDYSFLKHHLQREGFDLDTRKVCTVRLGRKVFGGLPSYSLGNFCRTLGIEINDRHRAMGDASATAALFAHLRRHDTGGHLKAMLRQGSRDAYLPLHLPAEQVEGLPQAAGVYYFHDAKDKVIYVGKAVNLRKRVVSHFSNNSDSRRKQEFMRNIHRISHRPCGSPLLASILESVEIRRLWPRFNYSQKRPETAYGIYVYQDRRGVIRLALDYRRAHLRPVATAPNLTEGYSLLRSLAREFGLCPRHCQLQSDTGACAGILDGSCRGVCQGLEPVETYNDRVLEAIEQLKSSMPSFALMEQGRHEGELSVVVVDKGEFVGFGHVARGVDLSDRDVLLNLVTPCHSTGMMRAMILREAERHPEKVVRFG